MKRKLYDDWNVFLKPAPSGDPAEDGIGFRSRTLDRDILLEPTLAHQPDGIRAAAIAAGVKREGVLDFSVVKLDEPGAAAGLFTTNLCPGSAVTYDREVLADGRAQALVVVSKNANVFTPTGDADTRALAQWVGADLGVAASDVVVSCTGVIGVPLPMEKLRAAIHGLSARLRPASLDEVARGILTTDRGPKVCSVRIGDLVLCAMAKGAGMIEPNMATMLVYIFTNADLAANDLRDALTEAAERTFNSLSVDSDTSTSDTLVVFSTCKAKLDGALSADFVDALRAASLKLGRLVVAEAEGTTKLIECAVHLDTNARDAKLVGKKIVNSPLVKTAVNGGDPNWGRVVMAIGKPDERLELRRILPSEVVIKILDHLVYDGGKVVPLDTGGLSHALKAARQVSIDVRIGAGKHRALVWGCDLSHGYVSINADYTT